jgi:chromosome segregation ATPase
MIARTVSLTITVKDFVAARASLDSILARHHGYSAQLTVSTPENSSRSFQASLRIPAPELAAALAELRSLGRVQNESQSGEEITQQHTDLLARLKNSRETESRLQAILQQRTGKVADILEVEEQIERVRGEIESMEAEQKTLEHRVDFASVDLQLTEEFKAQFNSPDTSASTRIHNAFIAGLDHATATLLGFVLFFEEDGPVILIWLVMFGVPSFLVWRRYRKVRGQF